MCVCAFYTKKYLLPTHNNLIIYFRSTQTHTEIKGKKNISQNIFWRGDKTPTSQTHLYTHLCGKLKSIMIKNKTFIRIYYSS